MKTKISQLILQLKSFNSLVMSVLVVIFVLEISCDTNMPKTIPLTTKGFIQEHTYLRAKTDLNSKKILALSRLEEIEFLLRGKEESFKGQKDYWYQIKTKNNEVGWVLGADTSLKQSGQKTAFLSFENYDFGDLEHYIFIDKKNKITLDFGQGNNNFGAFDFIFLNEEQEEYTGNPKYIGKEFKVTYNNLIAKVYCDYPIDTNICIKQAPTIIQIQIIE
jgi:hypothetical protein